MRDDDSYFLILSWWQKGGIRHDPFVSEKLRGLAIQSLTKRFGYKISKFDNKMLDGIEFLENIIQIKCEIYFNLITLAYNMDVTILLGSKSDMPVAEKCTKILEQFGVSYQLRVASAHRSPAFVEQIVHDAEADGVRVHSNGWTCCSFTWCGCCTNHQTCDWCTLWRKSTL